MMLRRSTSLSLIRRRSVAAMSTSKAMNVQELSERQSLRGKRVLVRTDFNVPMKKGESPAVISDDTRIRAALPTVNLLKEAGARTILCSHMGRPKGEVKEELKMAPVAKRLSELLGSSVEQLDDCIGDKVSSKLDQMNDGDIVMLENLRFYKQEEKNDPDFAKQLAHNADVFVNDAFGTAHRAHASTEGVTKHIETNVAGFLMEKELQYLARAVESPTRPLGAVIGGAKVSTKIPVLKSLLEKCDKILVGGGMIFTFYKAQGYDVGKSVVEEDMVEMAKDILVEADKRGVKVLLPTDIVIADRFEADAESKTVQVDAIPSEWMGLDVGPSTLSQFETELKECKTIVWNGPMGVFEYPKFAQGTVQVAQVLGECTKAGATTIVGGGDSVAAVEAAGLSDTLSHISTGGGASLELLEGKELPGVKALSSA